MVLKLTRLPIQSVIRTDWEVYSYFLFEYRIELDSFQRKLLVWRELFVWKSMTLKAFGDVKKNPYKQEGPECPNSLTWVSLSLVYSKRLWFLFVENECFQMTGLRFKNSVIQAFGAMCWCLAQIKSMLYSIIDLGKGGEGARGGVGLLDRCKIRWCLSFFFYF